MEGEAPSDLQRPLEANDADGSAPLTVAPLEIPTPASDISTDDSDEIEGTGLPDFTDEDAQSIISPSISWVATRLTSPNTPAAEKAAVIEDLGDNYWDSIPESPPSLVPSPTGALEAPIGQLPEGKIDPPAVNITESKAQVKSLLSLGSLPKPQLQPDSRLPISPWQAGPKPIVVPRSPQQSSLFGVFDVSRKRSLSGGADALRKLLPKSLPSITQVGNIFGSNSSQKFLPISRETYPKARPRSEVGLDRLVATSQFGDAIPVKRPISHIPSAKYSTINPIGNSEHPARPAVLRRVASDDALLYHTLSKTSSLGDDARFEGIHDQVNSRVKAIRDSFQDRSSFRMPNMPRRPTFTFSMNFLSPSSTPVNRTLEADVIPDIIPNSIAKKRQSTIQDGVVNSRVSASTLPRAEPAAGGARPVTDSPATGFLDRAMSDLTGDVVIMGGYRGSILRSAKPPHRQLWVPVKVGLNIRKVDLEVGLEPEDEERMEETIFASGMLQNIGPVDISKRLFKRLNDCENCRNGELRVWDFGYDWRLSPHLLSQKLTAFLEKLPCNQPNSTQKGALVISHSLGGLITRHVVNRRPELFSGVIYAGVPQSCVNILGPLRNGDPVMLSQRVLTAQVNFTLRTSFVLLPLDGQCFLDIKTKEKYPVDFFNPDDWIKYRLSPCTDAPLPAKTQPTSGLGSLMSISSNLLNLPAAGRKLFSGATTPPLPGQIQDENSTAQTTKTTRVGDALRAVEHGKDRSIAPQMGNNGNSYSRSRSPSTNTSVSTTVTLPRDKVITYLKRVLAETKKFKEELFFDPTLSNSNRYPPLALIYGKSIPTVYGAKVDGRDSIAQVDCYDNLAFASGDGVCLAREAMLPDGYQTVYGGRVSSDRGHVTLLGDLNAVGKAIEAVLKGRAKGIGMGNGV